MNASQSHPSLDVRVTIIPDDAPSPDYLALWRRLLAPVQTDAPADSAYSCAPARVPQDDTQAPQEGARR
jgi:hypothetical protein